MGTSTMAARWVLLPFALLLGGCSGEPTAPNISPNPSTPLPPAGHSPNMNCPKSPPGICLESIPGDEFLFTVLGDTWTWGIVVGRLGYDGAIELTVEGNLPPKVTAWLDEPSILKSNHQVLVSLNLRAEWDAPLGDHLITVRARGTGVPDATSVLRFIVAPPMN